MTPVMSRNQQASVRVVRDIVWRNKRAVRQSLLRAVAPLSRYCMRHDSMARVWRV